MTEIEIMSMLREIIKLLEKVVEQAEVNGSLIETLLDELVDVAAKTD